MFDNLEDLESRMATLSPPVALPPTAEDYFDRLRELEEEPEDDDDLEEEEEPEPAGILAGTPSTGVLQVTYEVAYIRRDESGFITEMVGNGWRKIIGRDSVGRIVSVTKETEEVFEEPAGDESGSDAEEEPEAEEE